MPNWCYTEYIFKGEPEEIDLFHQKIDEWAKDDTNSPFHVDNDFGNGWLGNIVNNSMEDLEAYNKTRCRGALNDIDVIEPGMLYLSTETAWCAAPIMWLLVLKKLNLKSIKMAFYEEEPCMDLFTIYDPDGIAFSDKEYKVNAYNNPLAEIEALLDELVSKSELVNTVNKLIPGDSSLDSKIEAICGTYDCSINKINRISGLGELLDMYGEGEDLEA